MDAAQPTGDLPTWTSLHRTSTGKKPIGTLPNVGAQTAPQGAKPRPTFQLFPGAKGAYRGLVNQGHISSNIHLHCPSLCPENQGSQTQEGSISILIHPAKKEFVVRGGPGGKISSRQGHVNFRGRNCHKILRLVHNSSGISGRVVAFAGYLLKFRGI